MCSATWGGRALPKAILAQARLLVEESVAWFRQARNEWGLAETLHHLGAVAAAQGNNAWATAMLNEGLDLQRKLGAKRLAAESLERFASLQPRGNIQCG
jgi:hypothetical protein